MDDLNRWNATMNSNDEFLGASEASPIKKDDSPMHKNMAGEEFER